LKKISVLFVLFILFFTGCNNGQSSDSLDWKTNLEQAIAEAKEEHKAVLVNFTGSDWCIWCKRLSDEVFQQKEFEEYAAENLILVKLDFPRNIPQTDETRLYNNTLAQRFGIEGFPTIIIINSQGKPIAKTGYRPGGAANYVAHIKSYL
jgi:thioredoxin-related protein